MEHQKEAGVFTTVSTLVDTLSDNPAARLTVQEILERLQATSSMKKRGTRGWKTIKARETDLPPSPCSSP